MNIASILRHWFTLAATLITGWLIATLALGPAQQAELTKALGDLVGPLVIVGTLIITAAWRIALAWIFKILRMGSGELEEKSSGSSGGTGLLLLIGMGAAVMGALPSCANGEYVGPPVKFSLLMPDGAVSLSSKSGIEGSYYTDPDQWPDRYERTIDRRSSK